MKSIIKHGKKQNLRVLLDKLKGISTIDSANNVKFDTLEIFELKWIFLSIIEFGCSLSIESKNAIISRTLRNIVIANDYDENNFCNYLNNEVINHNTQKERTFVLLTTVSIDNLPFRKIRIGDGTIRIHGAQFPTEFRQVRKDFLNSKINAADNKNYTKVSVIVKSKNPLDAYEKSYYFFEIFRSFLCLLLNPLFQIRTNDRNLEPINRIRQGEYSTLHTISGEIATNEIYWFVPAFNEAKVYSLPKGNSKKEVFRKRFKRLINCFNNCKTKHRATIGKALFNYAGAFDESNKFVSFLKTWMVLEVLTNTDQFDLLIRRATSMFDPKAREYQKQLLEALRLFRNEYVHKGNTGPDPLLACFAMQWFIANLTIGFHLEYAGTFNSIDESVDFMDIYMLDARELEKKRKILARAIYEKSKL